MPWEASQLWMAKIDTDGSFSSPVLVAGTTSISSSASSSSCSSATSTTPLPPSTTTPTPPPPTNESIFQPEWCPIDGMLYFISDRTSWGNLYRYRFSEVDETDNVDKSGKVDNLYDETEDELNSDMNGNLNGERGKTRLIQQKGGRATIQRGQIEPVFVVEGCECAEPQVMTPLSLV